MPPLRRNAPVVRTRARLAWRRRGAGATSLPGAPALEGPADQGEAVQRQRTEALLSALPNGVVMRAVDGQLILWNPAAEQQLQLSRAQMLGQQPIDPEWHTLHEDGRPMPLAERPAMRAMTLGHGLRSQLMGVRPPAGKLHWLMVNVELIRDADALPAGTVACFTDVTEQRRQQALFSHGVEATGVGAWDWDIDADSMLCNDRLWRMLGYRRGDVGQTLSEWNHLVHPDIRADWAAALADHLANPAVPCRAELRILRPDGDWAAVLSCGVVIASAQDGTPRRMAGIHVDMTEQMQMQAMLRHAARTDGLTQLPNRAAVFDQVQQAIDRAVQQPAHQFAVLFMNFDRFKQVNDTLGHAAGDELLRQIARRLRNALRAGDEVGAGAGHAAIAAMVSMAGRIGGDEVVVLLEGVASRDAACAVARRLMDVLAAPYLISGQQLHASASIGIVTSDRSANDAYTVMRDADTAMYEAKRNGRARFALFDPAMHERVALSVATESDLRLALARGELFVV